MNKRKGLSALAAAVLVAVVTAPSAQARAADVAADATVQVWEPTPELCQTLIAAIPGACAETAGGWTDLIIDTAATADQDSCIALDQSHGPFVAFTDRFVDSSVHPSEGAAFGTGDCGNPVVDPNDLEPAVGGRRTLNDPSDGVLVVQAVQVHTGNAIDVTTPADSSTRSRHTTYFNPGAGACGVAEDPSTPIAALAASDFDPSTPNGNPNRNPLCGAKIKVGRDGKEMVVRVVDRCAGCAPGDIDLSPAGFDQVAGLSPKAFDQVTGPSEGRVPITWTFV